MRAIWKGAISFGLVTIPVKLYKATARKSLKFNYLHRQCKTPLEYIRRCPRCGVDVPWEDTVRGYEYERGKYVVLYDEDFAAIPLELTKTVEIMDFVHLEEIDPIYFDKSYYLIPEETSLRAYNLLREAMERKRMVAMARVVVRDKQHLATVRAKNNVLILETMFYPDEIRSEGVFTEFRKEVRSHEKELQMAESLITNLAAEFDPNKYTDEYRKALLDIVKQKIEGKEVAIPVVPEEEKVISLMEALKESIERTRLQRKATSGQAKGKRKKAGGLNTESA
ncbi:MAG: Ku protein [Actinomycetota bacterium]|nr:Ku protein [Actinomycetota bacterium]